MDYKELCSLNSADGEKFVELTLVLQGKFVELVGLIKSGYALYVDVLTTMALMGGSEFIPKVLESVQDEKFNNQKMLSWLQIYFGDAWKDKIGEYKFIGLAREHLTSEECEKYQLWDALKFTNKCDALETLHKNLGMDYMKSYYEELAKSPLMISKEELEKLSYFLAIKQENAFLYDKEAYKYLNTFGGCTYIALKGNYTLLLSLISWNSSNPDSAWKFSKEYCFGVLERASASLSKEELKRYKQYKKLYK